MGVSKNKGPFHIQQGSCCKGPQEMDPLIDGNRQLKLEYLGGKPIFDI